MLNIGNYVRNKNNNKYGYITRKIQKRDEVRYVIMLENNMLITVSEDNLELVNINEKKQSYISNVYEPKITYELQEQKNDSNEIMLRHQTLDEAIFNLDKFIYNSISRNIKVVKIIHGRSGGILRKGVHDYLSKCPNVVDFRLGNYYEGSIGVTVATLK